MTEDVILQPMDEVHLDQIVTIERRLFTVPWTETMFRQEIRGVFGSRAVVAVHSVRVLGYRIAWFLESEVHLVNIAVDRPFQGLGIGTVLLTDLISEAIRERAELITLEVRAANARAQAFYGRHGFRQVGIRKGYYSDNREDAVLMTLDLPGETPADEDHGPR